MKKVLVLTIAAVIGLGFAAFADGLDGSWKATIGIGPVEPGCGVLGELSLGSTLKINYVLDDWTFGSVSTFGGLGFDSQKFTVAGVLGAFTLSSSMTFDPMAVTVQELVVFWDTSGATDVASFCCPLTYTAVTWGPRFLTWDASIDVSIAGVDVGVLVKQINTNYDVVTQGALFLAPLHEVQTDTISLASKTNGMGWRFKVAGTFGSVDVTSYTYFGMMEYTTAQLASTYKIYCPVVGKAGVFYSYVDCVPGFTEQYVLLEGFGFCCAEVAAELSITCDGFNYAKFLASDISIGGWASFDFALTFTTSSKAFDICISLDTIVFDCISLELGFGNTGYVNSTPFAIDNITVHGVFLECSWNGISFKSYTELDAYSALMSSSTAYSYLYGPYEFFVWMPYADKDNDIEFGDGWDEPYCVRTERYQLWEKFVIDVDADACCGGLFDLTVATFFGDHYTLDYVAYDVILKGTLGPAAAPIYLYGTTGATATAALTTAATWDTVNTKTGWSAGTQTTLFNWAKTEADLGLALGSNVTLTLGFDISVFGWENIDFGFLWEF